MTWMLVQEEEAKTAEGNSRKLEAKTGKGNSSKEEAKIGEGNSRTQEATAGEGNSRTQEAKTGEAILTLWRDLSFQILEFLIVRKISGNLPICLESHLVRFLEDSLEQQAIKTKEQEESIVIIEH